MPVYIDHSYAQEIMLEAYRSNCSKNDFITDGITQVLYGTHKTYKYVLVNGILAKATSNEANPIALQAGAPINGAFDARSLCHKVLVPFERDFLSNILGGSNEPFLNKPARFTHLSKNNAVRKGNDQEILNLLIKLLSSIASSEDAKDYLACIFTTLNKQINEKVSVFECVCGYKPTLIKIYEFSLRFVKVSFEGETSALIVGTLEKLFYEYSNNNYKVFVHKINQSGSSSREIGDIDIYNGNEYLYSIEVKDKIFNEYDLEHAFNKVFTNNGQKAAFVYGIQATFDEEAVFSKLAQFEESGFFVVLQDIESYIKNVLFRLPEFNKQDFIRCLAFTADSMNCKEETKNWIAQLFIELNWQI
jgi:hypothetical protein